MDLETKNLVLEKHAHGKEKDLVEAYIVDGPTVLREKLGLNLEEWKVVFDYLIFEKNLLYKTVINSVDFFREEYIKHGMAGVREILDVSAPKYDEVCKIIFDFLAIANEGLMFHVMQHREKYVVILRERGGDFVRKVLGIWQEKYEENWAKVLDFLLHAVCNDIFSQSTFDHGLRAFSRIFNSVREHRPICKSGLLPF